jgi:hypothetical protein
MVLGYSPHDMDRTTVGIPLQYQNTGTTREMRIILYDDGGRHADNHVSDKYIIGRQLVIAVRRNSNIPIIHESLHST